jgi:hypothetical protein
VTAAVLTPTERRWECLRCDTTAVGATGTVVDVEGRLGVRTLRPGENAAQMHHCRGLNGLVAPMVPAGTKGKMVTHERDDYLGDFKPGDIRFDGENRPIMNVTVTRDDGVDCAVYAPTATLTLENI